MKKIVIYTDGGSRGNPGKAAIGVVFCNEQGQVIKKYGEYLGDNFTNNEAEYAAVIFGLKKFRALFGKALMENTDLEIRADSELLVKQMNGECKVLDEKIQKLFLEVWNLKLDFKSVKFKSVLREKNKEANQMVAEAFLKGET